MPMIQTTGIPIPLSTLEVVFFPRAISTVRHSLVSATRVFGKDEELVPFALEDYMAFICINASRERVQLRRSGLYRRKKRIGIGATHSFSDHDAQLLASKRAV